jgi:hypothetical protein
VSGPAGTSVTARRPRRVAGPGPAPRGPGRTRAQDHARRMVRSSGARDPRPRCGGCGRRDTIRGACGCPAAVTGCRSRSCLNRRNIRCWNPSRRSVRRCGSASVAAVWARVSARSAASLLLGLAADDADSAAESGALSRGRIARRLPADARARDGGRGRRADRCRSRCRDLAVDSFDRRGCRAASALERSARSYRREPSSYGDPSPGRS